MPAGDPVVRLASRGDGITAAGVSVAGGVPGDVVLPDGSLVPGPNHAAPPCRHFPQCGGCQLQHVIDGALATFVTGRVTGPLRSVIDAATVIHPPYLSPPRSRRRATLGATWQARQLVLGFRSAATRDIVDMTECWLLTQRLFALVAPLRGWLRANLPPGASASVQLQDVSGGVDVGLASPLLGDFALAPALQDLAGGLGLVRLTVDTGDGPMPVWEPDPATVTLHAGDRAVPVRFPPASFQQPTADGEAVLRAIVTGAAAGTAKVIDLFAGLGTFALPLSQGRQVHAVEGARDTIASLLDAARSQRLPVTTEHRDLFRRPVSASELGRFDAAVIDPPRAGAAAQMAELAASSIRRVIAVSCNPATLGRDSAMLASAGFRLSTVHPVGQFRWSTHVEAVAVFDR